MPALTLEQANRIIAAALAKARALNSAPIGVAVLDAGGHLIALQREDGLSFLRVQICQAKAYGALGLGTHSRGLAERYERGGTMPGFFTALAAMTDGRVVPLIGGMLVRSAQGETIGAVGVAGAASEQDEACAIAGIEAAGLKVDP
jgi:uncharacterized protein GlcG (DUF336 family)